MCGTSKSVPTKPPEKSSTGKSSRRDVRGRNPSHSVSRAELQLSKLDANSPKAMTNPQDVPGGFHAVPGETKLV